MKQIISVSRRTDIPAFHAEWFMERIREGYCVVPNPRYPSQKTKPISLKASDVEAIVFWTRNPAPLMGHLKELDDRGYKYYFQYTIIGYPRDIEPKSPPLDEAIGTFRELSSAIGREKVIWRYDPILFSNITDHEWHVSQITKIAERLAGYTERLVISFIDRYRKAVMRMEKETGGIFRLHPRAFDAETYRDLAKWIGTFMKTKGISVVTCAEDIELGEYGIGHGKCIDDELIGRILNREIVGRKDTAQRKACRCVESRDIGTNDTCLFGCRYCYAR